MHHSFAFQAIGTTWRIDTEEPLSAELTSQVLTRTELFDATYSRFRSDSLVSQVARGAGVVQFPDDVAPLFSLFRQLYDWTDGAVTPLVGLALEHLGYGPGYRLRRRHGRAHVPAWDDVLHVDGTVVSTTEAVVLDVGAAGKGFLVDLVAGLLDAAGVSEYVVDASGDLIHRGSTAERVGLENPLNPQQVIGVAELHNTALCASATNRRRWGAELHHILDPRTGEPTVSASATWVVSRSCAVADGLATALFLVDPAELADHVDYSYVRMTGDQKLQFSSNFEGVLFS